MILVISGRSVGFLLFLSLHNCVNVNGVDSDKLDASLDLVTYIFVSFTKYRT